MRTNLRRVGAALLDWFLPQTCLGCSVTVHSDEGFCVDCREQLKKRRPDKAWGDYLTAPYQYMGPLKTAIHRLKFEERSEYAGRLVACCFSEMQTDSLRDVTLLPVPIHPSRLVERGYNQAGLLAQALGRRWALPVRYDILLRRHALLHQVGLGREERKRNVAGAFYVKPGKCYDFSAVLVDDVVTTGATTQSCAEALTQAGIRVTGVVALALADKDVAPPTKPLRPIAQVLGLEP